MLGFRELPLTLPSASSSPHTISLPVLLHCSHESPAMNLASSVTPKENLDLFASLTSSSVTVSQPYMAAALLYTCDSRGYRLCLREEDRPWRAGSRRRWLWCQTSPGPAGPALGPRSEPGSDRWRGDAAGRPDPSECGCCSSCAQEQRRYQLQMWQMWRAWTVIHLSAVTYGRYVTINAGVFYFTKKNIWKGTPALKMRNFGTFIESGN